MTCIREARADEVDLVRGLFREYQTALGRDLSFQEFERELDELPGFYRAILLAERDGAVVGCAAVRELAAETAELKRLYVQPQARGLGLGRQLTLSAIHRARDAGFRAVRLDTLPEMTAAVELYRSLGFREIPAYRHNPIAGARYFELDLALE